MIITKQSNFDGGMNMLSDESQIGDDQYVWLINGRVRQGGIKPVTAPIKSSLPDGIKQGIYTAGQYLVAFVAGRAYYRSINTDSWTLIAGFQMSTTEANLYACLIPASYVNFVRKASEVSSAILATETIIRTPAALLVQDGTNQPRLIYVENNIVKTRTTLNYSQWTKANPEYVPIGKQMVYHNGKLYIVNGRDIYSSVTGQPLNFVINVDPNGDKSGDATTTSHAVDYNEITCLGILNKESLFVATAYSVYSLTLNLEFKLFGEPTFNNEFLFSAGVVNQFSLTDYTGDTAFIDFEGIKSFNAVLQLTNEGNNNPISLNLARIFNGIKQNICAAVSFDNYALFAVQTTFGDCIVVWDTLTEKLVSIDLFEDIGQVAQFAIIKDSSTIKLFARSPNNVYELYSNAGETQYCLAYFKHRTYDKQFLDHQSVRFKALFEEGDIEQNIMLIERADNRQSAFKELVLGSAESGIEYPILSPVIVNTQPRSQTVTFDLSYDSIAGRKLGHILKWTGNARLVEIEHISQALGSASAQQEQANV